jgi:hypothetical protein
MGNPGVTPTQPRPVPAKDLYPCSWVWVFADMGTGFRGHTGQPMGGAKLRVSQVTCVFVEHLMSRMIFAATKTDCIGIWHGLRGIFYGTCGIFMVRR